MAVGTVVSRATGLIRQVLQAAALGTGLLASTYNTANTVPTSLYTLLIGGALNAVLVPQLVRARATQPDGGQAYEQRPVTLVRAGRRRRWFSSRIHVICRGDRGRAPARHDDCRALLRDTVRRVACGKARRLRTPVPFPRRKPVTVQTCCSNSKASYRRPAMSSWVPTIRVCV